MEKLSNRMYKIKWTKEKCAEEAVKYNSRLEFINKSLNAYNAARRNKWLDEICKHMGKNKIKNNYWTKEKCAEEALKYKSKNEFEKGSPTAYVKSGKMGWKDEICSHMNSNGNKYSRCVYAIEFPDNHVYIGLTYNYEKRFLQHLNDIKNNSIVLKHFKKIGLFPNIKKLTDYIDVDQASKIETLKVDEYANNGWFILNIAKCGNVGGKTIKWTKENCNKESLKYDSRNDFKKNSPHAYNAARRNKWIDEICSHMKHKLEKWNVISCEEESKKFKSKQDFKNNSSGAYGFAYKNNLLNTFFPIKNDKMSESINENYEYLPTYQECVDLCLLENSPFYESKNIVDGYNVSLFNYRLATYKDFLIEPYAKEMRGLCFVFNKDGSVYNRYILLEKFFNLNQVPESMYSIVKNYKIKFVNEKEDGSIASFIQLPNGRVVGRSKMGFDNDQANGINKVYKTNKDVKLFVDYFMSINCIPIFEYVSIFNRIVLRYSNEELILLRLRDNKTGKHIDLKDHLDKLGSMKIAPFKDDFTDLDTLIELTGTEIDKEGYVVQAEDEFGNDFLFKLKTPWYMSLHGLLTDDIYKENIIIHYILDDKIDDILGQIPETEFEAHDRINKITSIVKKAISEKVDSIEKSYQVFVDLNKNRKEYALKYRNSKNFPFVMEMDKGRDPYELAKKWIKDNTKKLLMARNWLKLKDPELFFKNVDEEYQDQ